MSSHDESEEESFAAHTLVQAIENQLESDDPPAARATLNKLSLVGFEREEILHLMALVLADEINIMMRDNRPFDRQRYELALRALPSLPGEDDTP